MFYYIKYDVTINVKIAMGMWFRIPITSILGISGLSPSKQEEVNLSICLIPSPIASINIQLAARFFIPSGEP